MPRSTVLLLLVVVSCDRGRTMSPLFPLERQRLELMHDVARWKWNENKPIEDPERERALLDEMARQGEALGLKPVFVRGYFKELIAAAKDAQRADFARWEEEKQGRFATTRDLAELRKEIDRINGALLKELAAQHGRR